MKLPLQITFKGMPHSDAIEANVRRHAARLDRFHPRITRCDVLIEKPHRHHRKGNLYTLRIDLTIPGHEINVRREPDLDHSREDIEVAIRDAFKATVRQLEDRARRDRGHVKYHETPPHGRIKLLFPAEGYGFIETPDGREIYFHRNSVVGDAFATLQVGAEVRYVVAEDSSDKGPQASTVTPVGKHHLVDPSPYRR